jgi:drug/metabolite transporter (DMT)-like permease
MSSQSTAQPAVAMGGEQWSLLVLLSVLWGGSFLFVGIAIKELSPLCIVLVRVCLAALLLAPFLWMRGIALPGTVAAWLPFAVMGLLNNVIPFTLIASGQQTVASGLASILNAATPLFTLVIAHIFTVDERLRSNRLAGVLIGIAGVGVLMGPEAIAGRTSSLLGMSLCLAGCISYGFAGLWGRRLRSTPPLVSATAQLVSSTVILGLLVLLLERPTSFALPSLRTTLALVGLAALSTSIAYVIFFRLLVSAGPTNTMLVTLLIPVSGVLLGSIVLAEALEPRHIIGSIVIGSGLLLIDGRMFSRRA